MLIIYPLSAFNDNYIWMFHAPNSRDAYVVDPGDSKPVEKALLEKGLNLAGILITHHHFDHTGGIGQLTEGRDITVYGPNNQNISGITHTVQGNDSIQLGECHFSILSTPGHTLDHIAYFTQFGESGNPALFCGDTLFVGGCGRLFEGTAKQMYSSLTLLASLPEETRVYCAHEYTQDNLRFALTIEPQNKQLQDLMNTVKNLRSKNQPTVPSTIRQELATNPFLRTNTKKVVQAVYNRDPALSSEASNVFKAIRAWKDVF